MFAARVSSAQEGNFPCPMGISLPGTLSSAIQYDQIQSLLNRRESLGELLSNRLGGIRCNGLNCPRSGLIIFFHQVEPREGAAHSQELSPALRLMSIQAWPLITINLVGKRSDC